MVKNISILIVMAISFSACSKNDSMVQEPTVVKYPTEENVYAKNWDKNERSIYYKGG